MLERLVWIIPIGVAALGLWRPRAGLLLLTACLPLFGAPPGGPYLGALEAAGVAAVVTAWRGGRQERSALSWPAAAFVMVSLLSLCPSPYLPPSWRPSALLGLLQALPGVETWTALYTWRAAADLILGWALFLAVRRAFAGRSPKPLGLALLAGLGASLVVGLASFANWVDLGSYRPLLTSDPAFRRLSSVFFLSGWLAEYIVLAAPLALATLARASGWTRHLLLPFVALAVACLALTQQRGSWIAAAAQLLFVAAATASRWRRQPAFFRKAAVTAVSLGLVAVILVVGVGSLGPIVERVRSLGSGGLSGRFLLWDSAAEMARERPLLGWGLGSFAQVYELSHPRGSAERHHFHNTAHSLYMNVAAERGVLGLMALGLLGWAAASCLRRPRAGQQALAVALAATLLGAAVYGLVQYLFHVRAIGWLCWILIGCVALVSRPEGELAPGRWGKALVFGSLLLLPFRLWYNEPPQLAGNRSFGFHEPETSAVGEFRWTEGLAAQRLPWTTESLVLSLANGHPRAQQRPITVAVSVDGKLAERLTIRGGWEEHRIELGPPRRDWFLLTIRARPTFRPFSEYLRYEDIGPSKDIRRLGVAVRLAEPGE